MDVSLIVMVKKNYCYCLLCLMLEMYNKRIQCMDDAKKSTMKAGTLGLKEGHPPHLRDVMDILSDDWDEVSEGSSKRCWLKTTLISPDAANNQPYTTQHNQQCVINEEGYDEEEWVEEHEVDEDNEIFSLFQVILKFGDLKLSTYEKILMKMWLNLIK